MSTETKDIAQRLADFTCRNKCGHLSCQMEREAVKEIKRLRRVLGRVSTYLKKRMGPPAYATHGVKIKNIIDEGKP